MNEHAQVPLSPEVLAMMRDAARISVSTGERFVTARCLLLAMLNEPTIGPLLAAVLDRDRLEALPPFEDERNAATQVLDSGLEGGERAAIVRYDTLAFKIPGTEENAWLSHESYAIFVEGARRAEGRYLPKDVALGMAAEALRAPGLLANLHLEPGAITEAILRR